MFVIDDSCGAAELLAALLQRVGHTVGTTGDGPMGTAIATDFVPHVVLCDLDMPEADGYMGITELRAPARRSAITRERVASTLTCFDRSVSPRSRP
ncbi:response regulator [Nannocystis exedens]|uniref:response regulator n=1 Tax=Nannocystis exedens TaxID=54 RepID=UPI00147326BD|nr:response regulator [Nannocystis exedens]